jgi:hypothetical protein
MHDFDPLIGTWNVHHRRLKERLTGCTEWEEFGGTTELRTLVGGLMNVDDNVLHLPAGTYRAATVRAFDAKTGLWSIWWFDSRNLHQLEPPVVGRFEAGVGTFYADDTLRGQPIKVRFLWSDIASSSPKWEQAFSPDGGKTWETNWEMRFSRRG